MDEQRHSNNRVRSIRWTIFLMAVIVAIITGCRTAKDETLPTELVGRWVTDAPGYEACYTEITETTIQFYTAERTLRQYTIDRIEREVKEKNEVSHDVLDIHYSDQDGDTYLLSIMLIQVEGQNRLQFFHQPHLVWKKDA